MKRYYVNVVAKENGDNELHHEYCLYVPVIINAQYIGEYSDDKLAIVEAQKIFPNVNGCKHCCSTIHIEYEME